MPFHQLDLSIDGNVNSLVERAGAVAGLKDDP
jgi:hypothetical protein